MSDCILDKPFEDISAIPGNIGIARAKVLVWDHDPFKARPNQTVTLAMSSVMKERIDNSFSPGILFEAGAAVLQPVYNPQPMLIAAIYPAYTSKTVKYPPGLDWVYPGPPTSNRALQEYQNSADLYKTGTKFPNMNTWIHTGSLFEEKVWLYPSEYNSPDLDSLAKLYANGDVSKLKNAAKWSYVDYTENGLPTRYAHIDTVNSQTTTETPQSTPIHWSIERYYNVWQGVDFWLTIHSAATPSESLPPQVTEEVNSVSTVLADYKYIEGFPSGVNIDKDFVYGISNGAYYEDRETAYDPTLDSDNSGRYGFWKNNWKYKTYILVELGYQEGHNHFFIEFVKGGKPRFIEKYIGYDYNTKKYLYFTKALSQFPVAFDDMLEKGTVKFLLRNQLGNIIISFTGYENQPWIISKTFVNDKNETESTPIVTPAGKIRIHGGNIPCDLNFSIATYGKEGRVILTGDHSVEMDSHMAVDDDLYMLFSHFGNSENTIPKKLDNRFSDPRLGYFNGKGIRIGFDSDAHYMSEIVKNQMSEKDDIYDNYSDQFKQIGRGYPVTKEGKTLSGENDPNNPSYTLRYVKPCQLRITNYDWDVKKSTTGNFDFGLPNTNTNFTYPDYVSSFSPDITLTSGSATDGTFVYENAITPIVCSINITLLGGEKPFQDKVDPIDITPLVLKISESWKAEDYSYINHEMQLTCYLPIGPPIVNSTSSVPDIYSTAKKLYNLHDKIFYLTVSYWWDKGIGRRTIPGIPSYCNPEDSQALIQFTGVATNSKFDKTVNQLNMNITVKDYSWILDKQYIYNCPFFDACSDVVAIYELAKMAGLDDKTQIEEQQDRKRRNKPVKTKSGAPEIDRRPLGYLQQVINFPRDDGKYFWNFQRCITRNYNLPGTLASTFSTNSKTRAQNGKSFLEFMKELARISPKTLYFDQWGVLKYENLPSVDSALSNAQSSKQNTGNNPQQTLYNTVTPKVKFYTTPLYEGFDPDKDAAYLVYNSVSYERSVEDCFNHIGVISAGPELKRDAEGNTTGGLIAEGHTFYEQIWDPTAEGFIGFRKAFFQENGVFGGRQEVLKTIQHYAKMKYPVTILSFQTYGIPGLKALDIISVDDNIIYITDVSHEIDPQNNRWWMTITGEWFKPFTGSLTKLDTTEDTFQTTPTGQ